MPWTPYLLRSLLDWDAKIVIAEGAADTQQRGSNRSTDGSLELIKLFAEEWKDRVSLYYHKFNPRAHTRPQMRQAKAAIKVNLIWNNMEEGDWMVGVAADNYYTLDGIAKLREIMTGSVHQSVCQIATMMRVFVYNFQTMVKHPIKGICGPWYRLWPCTYRKNPKWNLMAGCEVLVSHENITPTNWLIHPNRQRKPLYKVKDSLVVPDVTNFHYKGVKMLYTREKRMGKQNSKIWWNYPLNGRGLTSYRGEHPELLEDHPWREVDDCRKHQGKWDWEDFTHLVKRNERPIGAD